MNLQKHPQHSHYNSNAILMFSQCRVKLLLNEQQLQVELNPFKLIFENIIELYYGALILYRRNYRSIAKGIGAVEKVPEIKKRNKTSSHYCSKYLSVPD